ncbi:endonuclease III domain-containing protein [Pararhizobium mangrovi]|uniref:Endonuclease III n=1 Tax=Pararhizobium mangrovi TaxID=2590452 RepID=A0A506TZ27_9HYPH|nr:endonuclease III [Pararhizobium mangrovi]TPW26458.1 endonuclease III [Pararhizobium mangrovi]
MAEDGRTLLTGDEIETVFERLKKAMPGKTKGAKGPKDQPDPFRSCIACMLSAQSRDTNTAKATAALFRKARTPETMLTLSDDELIEAIKPAGLYNSKARSIRKFCHMLIEECDGVVPNTRAGLMKMPGIGRKCADIVMAFTFEEDAIAVDTHVGRVCTRTGLAQGKSEAKIAESLDERAPDWAKPEGHFWLIQFGKRVCTSRAPKCPECVLNDVCLFPQRL